METGGKHQIPLRILSALLILLTIAALLLVFVSAIGTVPSVTAMTGNGTMTDFTADWTVQESDFSGAVSYSCIAPESLPDEAVLIFENDRQAVEVYADDTLLYQINTTEISRMIHANSQNLVLLPKGHDYTITFVISGYEAEPSLPSILYGTRSAGAGYLIRQEIFTVLNIILLIVLGFVLLISMAFFHVREVSDNRIISLGAFILIAAVWGFADSPLGLLIGLSQEVSGLIDYYCLMILPIPIIYYAWLSCKRQHKVLPIMMHLCLVEVFVLSLLAATGLVSLDKLRMLQHLMVASTVVLGLICSYRSKKSDKDSELRMLYWAFCLLAAMTVLSMLVYWFFGGAYYRAIMLSGVSIFLGWLLILLIYTYSDIFQSAQLEAEKVQLYRNLSLTDTLTGLGNRKAFENRLAEIDEQPDKRRDAVLIMMDLNGLKHINDNYGHNAGDEIIVDAAKCISSVYGGDGDCFRIGGDEFTVILDNPVHTTAGYARALDIAIEDYNRSSLYKLSIARGESHLVNSGCSRISISNWKQEADVRMYTDKAAKHVSRPVDRTRELQAIIDMIVNTVEAKDEYTGGHSNRVRELSLLISEKLGLSPETVDRIGIAAQLHDLGKIGVPDNVLTKPGALTDDEYALMKRHPVIGADIVFCTGNMDDIAEMILHHHERFDGRGYPDGLKGEDIPHGARVIALADSIDAMTSSRCYRGALSIDQCRAEIEKNLGRMYDPAIGQIVLQNWNEIQDIILLHPKRLLHLESDPGQIET